MMHINDERKEAMKTFGEFTLKCVELYLFVFSIGAGLHVGWSILPIK